MNYYTKDILVERHEGREEISNSIAQNGLIEFLVSIICSSLLIPCRFFSLVDSRLILTCLLVHTYLSVAAQSPPNVLPKSSVLIAFYILKIYLPYSLYSLNSFFNSIKEIPQLLPRSPPIDKTLQTI
jgi:hypothetical protein